MNWRRSLPIIENPSAERRSLSALCGGKATKRRQSVMPLTLVAATRLRVSGNSLPQFEILRDELQGHNLAATSRCVFCGPVGDNDAVLNLSRTTSDLTANIRGVGADVHALEIGGGQLQKLISLS